MLWYLRCWIIQTECWIWQYRVISVVVLFAGTAANVEHRICGTCWLSATVMYLVHVWLLYAEPFACLWQFFWAPPLLGMRAQLSPHLALAWSVAAFSSVLVIWLQPNWVLINESLDFIHCLSVSSGVFDYWVCVFNNISSLREMFDYIELVHWVYVQLLELYDNCELFLLESMPQRDHLQLAISSPESLSSPVLCFLWTRWTRNSWWRIIWRANVWNMKRI